MEGLDGEYAHFYKFVRKSRLKVGQHHFLVSCCLFAYMKENVEEVLKEENSERENKVSLWRILQCYVFSRLGAQNFLWPSFYLIIIKKSQLIVITFFSRRRQID